MNLQDLKTKSEAMERTLDVRIIDKFIKDSVIALLTEWDGFNLEEIGNLEEVKEFDGTKWTSYLPVNNKTIELVNNVDISLSFSGTLKGNYEPDGEFDYSELFISDLKLYWLDNEFDLKNEREIEKIIEDKIW